VLGDYRGVLLTDGYPAYNAFVNRVNDVVHAQCWSHSRRHFLKAEGIEPELTATALEFIRGLYEEERKLSARQLDGTKRLEQRAMHCKPIVDRFFEWLKTELEQRVLLPSNPFTGAAEYVLSREKQLRVFLEYPDVPIDTNHLEREIRPIALGRKNWMCVSRRRNHVGQRVQKSMMNPCSRLDGGLALRVGFAGERPKRPSAAAA